MRQIAPPLPSGSTSTPTRLRDRIVSTQHSEPPAYRLYPNIREIFSHLIHFENAILVVRARGISCSKTTSFGAFRPATTEQDSTLFTDKVSGLTIDFNEVDDAFLLDGLSSGPSLEILFKGDGFAVSIEPDESAYSNVVIGHLIDNYASGKIASAVLRNSGAGAWLDEWQHVQSRGTLRHEALNQFTASFEGRGFRFRTSGETLTDYPDPDIHRITARDERTHIFADNSVILNPTATNALYPNARN